MCTQMVQCSALHAQTAYNSVMSTQMVESFGICMQMKMGSAVCAQLVEYSVMCTQMVQRSALHAQMAYNSVMCTHGRVCIDVYIMVVIHSVWLSVQLYMHIW